MHTLRRLRVAAIAGNHKLPRDFEMRLVSRLASAEYSTCPPNSLVCFRPPGDNHGITTAGDTLPRREQFERDLLFKNKSHTPGLVCPEIVCRGVYMHRYLDKGETSSLDIVIRSP